MEEYKFLLDIAIILSVTKLLSILIKRINLPSVVGALIAGIILGPVVLNVINTDEIINSLAEIGVIVLMFQAGLETDIKELKKTGFASFIIAFFGVMIPLILGFIVSYIYDKNILENIFIGVILTATSVSITVETLQEMGKLKTPAGTAILGAAIIDDILGIILLSMVTSFGNSSSTGMSNIFIILGKIIIFFLLACVLGIIVFKFFKFLESRSEMHRRRIPVFAFAFCLFLAFFSELFGIADITGAYLAGVILCNLSENKYILSKVEVVSYMLITPIFFASIGLKTSIDGMSNNIIIYTIVITLIAIFSKVIGCSMGAKLVKFKNKESIQIGVGMISRGEVALIMANKGMAVGVMNKALFAPIVLMVIITTLLTPILLKFIFANKVSDK